MDLKLTDALRYHALTRPDGIATSCNGRRRTWTQLLDRVSRLAAALQHNGMAPGGRVGILTQNCDHYLETMLAVWWGGGAINPVNIRWSATEVAYSLDDCDTQILVVDDHYAAMVPDLRERSSVLDTVITCGEGAPGERMIAYESLISGHAPIADVAQDAASLAGVFYTGGTTGFPKGVQLTHASMSANTMLNLVEMPIVSDDVILAVAPMFHLAGMCIVLRAVFRGATSAFIGGFEEKNFLEVAEREGMTVTLLVPVMLQRLLDCGLDLSRPLRTWRMAQYGASPIGERVLQGVIERLPNVRLIQGYGMTETSGPYTVLPAEFHLDAQRYRERLRSAGRPALGIRIKIVDEAGNELPAGSVGEIVCQGPIVMQGYWNKPDMTASSLVDGWMHSGDMGYLDEEGYLYIVDRLKDMIVSGGENVYSAEVENALSKHSAIAACAVIGIPSARWGEQIHAIVVLKPDMEATPEALRAHCKTLIAGYKCPVSVEFRTELPYTGAGKLQKNELREPFWKDHKRRVA